MRIFQITKLGFALALVLTFAVACDRSASAPPAPLAIEQVPAALQKAFSKAKPEAKELVTQVVNALQAQDYPKAFLSVQTLASRSGLDKEQQSVTSRAVLAVNTLLQTAQTKGDSQAAETLKSYRINK
jgi:hypothetical protein